MKQLALPFKQLVDRKLWPLAVLLVAALVAVPTLLGKDPETPPPAAAVAGGEGLTEPIASVADPSQTDVERKVLGSAKNPFRPALKAVEAKPTATPEAPGTGGAGAGGGDATGGAGAGDTPAAPDPVTAPAAPVATATPVPAKEYELYSLSVKFGPSEGPLAKRTLERLKGLPGGQRPALLYLGLKKDKKTAVFMVDATATVQGDGTCTPSPENCQTLELKAGDVEFIDTASGKQYELDLVKIHTETTTDAKEAASARAAEAKGGRRYLRANASRVGRYRYSAADGLLNVIPVRTWKTSVAGAAAAAAGSAG